MLQGLSDDMMVVEELVSNNHSMGMSFTRLLTQIRVGIRAMSPLSSASAVWIQVSWAGLGERRIGYHCL